MLPDGSCSSITLRSGSFIREVLQDLCQSIGVNIAAVDLFLVGGEKVRQESQRGSDPVIKQQHVFLLSSRVAAYFNVMNMTLASNEINDQYGLCVFLLVPSHFLSHWCWTRTA